MIGCRILAGYGSTIGKLRNQPEFALHALKVFRTALA
jgi:hypothetical protein